MGPSLASKWLEVAEHPIFMPALGDQLSREHSDLRLDPPRPAVGRSKITQRERSLQGKQPRQGPRRADSRAGSQAGNLEIQRNLAAATLGKEFGNAPNRCIRSKPFRHMSKSWTTRWVLRLSLRFLRPLQRESRRHC